MVASSTACLGWADPRRATSIGLVTSGKPALAPHLPDFWNLTRRIGLEAPKGRPADAVRLRRPGNPGSRDAP